MSENQSTAPEPEPAAPMLDSTNMAAAGLRAGMPKPTSITIDSDVVRVHVHDAADSRTWVTWWTDHGTGRWRNETVISNGFDHYYLIGTWRGVEVQIVDLLPHEQREVVPV